MDLCFRICFSGFLVRDASPAEELEPIDCDDVMNSEVAILDNVGLEYRRARHREATLKQSFISVTRQNIRYEEWVALEDISFALEASEVLAVVGSNGAGKSSLLKLLAKIMAPTKGRVIVRGRVSPMIELGAGFNRDLTAKENILLYGSLLGRPYRELKSRINAIVEWADLGEHLDVPLRSFSSGMIARLGFAVATDEVPDLLLIDEVLSVGDASFRERSTERIHSLIDRGSAVVLVTHDLESACALATRGLWLNHGEGMATGPVREVVNKYLQSVSSP